MTLWASACTQMGDGEHKTDCDNQGSIAPSGSTPCQRLQERVVACYDDYCACGGGSTPFCRCWSQGYDIDTGACTCRARDLQSVCTTTNETDFKCTNAATAVEAVCGG